MYGLADITPDTALPSSSFLPGFGPSSPIGQFAIWVRNQFTPPVNYVPPAAPTGSLLTQPPASGEQAQATVDQILNDQMKAQQAAAAAQVKSGWLDYLSSNIVDTGNSLNPFNADSSTLLLWGGIAAVVVLAVVAVSGGGRRR